MLAIVLQGSGKQFWCSPPKCLFLPLNAEHVEFSSLLITEGLAVSDLCRGKGTKYLVVQIKNRYTFYQRLHLLFTEWERFVGVGNS